MCSIRYQDPVSITIWEAGFASTHAATDVETLSIPDSCRNPDILLAHPTLPRLALARRGRVRIWDTQDSKFLLDTVDAEPWGMTFSPDGRFFAFNGTVPEGGGGGGGV